MPISLKKIRILAETSLALHGVGMLIVEKEEDVKSIVAKARSFLSRASFQEVEDSLAMMDLLNQGKDRIFYVEKSGRLDSAVLEIIAEFDAGIVSLADRKHGSGLKTAKFHPSRTSLVIVMTRNQVEKSYARLFSCTRFTQSI